MADDKPTFTVTVSDASETIIINNDQPKPINQKGGDDNAASVTP